MSYEVNGSAHEYNVLFAFKIKIVINQVYNSVSA